MFLQNAICFQYPFSALQYENSFGLFSICATAVPSCRQKYTNPIIGSQQINYEGRVPPTAVRSPLLFGRRRMMGLSAFKKKVNQLHFDEKNEEEGNTSYQAKEDDSDLMDEEERKIWRRTIREVMEKNPHVEEETDPDERRKKMQKLLAEYPLVIDEEDPDWPDDGDGWGFNLGQFFNKITINNVKRDDDENYNSDKELVWQDDNYIRPIKDITIAEWEETVFKDISPLVVFVHNRYKRPKENEMARDGLEKVAHIFWNSRLPSPRCVAIDAVVEVDLVSALKVSVFPEIIFTKAGKILYREKSARTADELSKIMAFFYYGATKPPYLNIIGDGQELIPSVPSSH